MKKRLISIFWALCVILIILPISGTAKGSTTTVYTFTQFSTAINDAPTDGTERIIEIGADMQATSGINVYSNKNIVIKSVAGSHYTITRASTFTGMFAGISGSKLTLKDVTLDGNATNVVATGAMVYMWSGEFTMDTGACIQNIKGALGSSSIGVGFESGSIMTMNEGSVLCNVENTSGYSGILVKGTLYMNGGSITGCKGATNSGVVIMSGATFNMSGGSITGNTSDYGGIRNMGNFIVSGAPNISGNMKMDGTACNVRSLPGLMITVGPGGLTSTAHIGVTSYSAPTISTPVNITMAGSQDWSSNFSSDNSSYLIQNSGSDANQVLQLAMQPYNITASPTSKDFGSQVIGSAVPTAQTVTVTNTWNTSLNLTQPTSTNYTVGTLSTTTLAAGGTATFTIQPKEGLVEGSYPETIAVSSDHSTSANMNVTYVVMPIPTYTITASPTSKDFGSQEVGSALPPAQTITVTNTGNTSLTLTQPTSTNYTIGTLSATTVAAGGTATFTFQPKAGLVVGSYPEAITVSSNHSTSATVNVTFVVTVVPTYTISVDSTSKDFGSQEVGSVVPTEHTVTVTNTGNTSLTLTQPTSTNYTIGTLSTITLAAGESATFTIQPKAGLEVGSYTESITVSSSHSTSALVNVAYVVTAIPTYTITFDSTNKNFGSQEVGSELPAAQTVTVTNTGNTFLTLTQPTSTNYTIETLSATTLAAGGTATFTIQPKAGLAVGSYDETITVSSNHSTSASVNVTYAVTAISTYTITVDPASKDFGSQEIGSAVPTAQTVTVTNTGNTSLALTQPTVTNYTVGALSASTLAEGATATFTIQPKAGLAVGSYDETITVSSNHSTSASVSVTYAVTAIPTYTITVDPASKDFGSQEVGSELPAAQTVTVTNIGNTSLTLTRPTSTNYKIGALSTTTLEAGESATFTIQPKAGLVVGSYTEGITVSSNHSTSATVDVTYVVTVVPTYTITVDSTSKDFGSQEVDSAVPTAQTVTVTNTGNSSLTLTQPTGTNYTVGTLSATTLAAGGTATFTIQPKAGLAVGSYDETITVSSNDSTSASVSVTYAVTAVPTYALVINGSYAVTSGAGSYVSGSAISIDAGIRSGYTFTGWTSSNGGTFASANSAGTTFTMPSNATTITASWSIDSNNSANSGGSNPATPATPATPSTTPVPEVPVTVSEQIKVEVKQGETNHSVSNLVIDRTTDVAGVKSDVITYQEEKANETIQKLKEEGNDVARIVIPDTKDEVSKTTVNIPSNALEVIAKGEINLQIDTQEAKINLPKESLQSVSNSLNKDLYFNIVPIKEEIQKEEVTQRALLEVGILNGTSETGIAVMSVPVTIETNMPSSAVDITLPLTGISIPNDQTQREAFLSQLAVYVEHSDGTKELLKGEIVEYKEGLLGIKFHITKFSIFTIVNTGSVEKDSACDVISINTLANAVITGQKITASVVNTTTSLDLQVTVSDKGLWNVYSDKACTKEFTDNMIKLKVGSNKVYLKVTAEDGTTKTYTLTVTRNKSVASDITMINMSSKAIIIGQKITTTVENTTTSSTIKVSVSDKASWKLYSDKQCKKELTNHKLKLKVGVNKVYIKVTAEDGTTSKVYTLTITRQEAPKKVIIIATKYDFNDAFAGGVLAGQLGGSVICTGISEKDAKKMLSYIKKNYSKQDEIYIIGLGQAVNENLEKMLKKEGYTNIVNIGGEDKYETAKLIADNIKLPDETKVVLVSGETVPKDADNIQKICAELGYPILFVETDSLTTYTIEAMKVINPAQIYIVGDKSQISSKVVTEIVKLIRLDKSDIIRINVGKEIK